jgi:hypothetical protein
LQYVRRPRWGFVDPLVWHTRRDRSSGGGVAVDLNTEEEPGIGESERTAGVQGSDEHD